MKTLQRVACLFLVVVPTSSFGHQLGKTCPPLDGKTPFDAEKFQGLWYLISISGDSEDDVNWNETCSRWVFTTELGGDENRFNIDLRVKTLSGSEQGYSLHCLAEDPLQRASSEMHCTIFLDTIRLGHVVNQTVLVTDYKTFAVTRMCGSYVDTSRDYSYSNIYIQSRKPLISKEELQGLKKVAAGFGELSANGFKDLNNSRC